MNPVTWMLKNPGFWIQMNPVTWAFLVSALSVEEQYKDNVFSREQSHLFTKPGKDGALTFKALDITPVDKKIRLMLALMF